MYTHCIDINIFFCRWPWVCVVLFASYLRCWVSFGFGIDENEWLQRNNRAEWEKISHSGFSPKISNIKTPARENRADTLWVSENRISKKKREDIHHHKNVNKQFQSSAIVAVNVRAFSEKFRFRPHSTAMFIVAIRCRRRRRARASIPLLMHEIDMN